jgi:ABC-type multidrug transport system fused ATPase/permease subunit
MLAAGLQANIPKLTGKVIDDIVLEKSTEKVRASLVTLTLVALVALYVC